jgi:hypothetical protein
MFTGPNPGEPSGERVDEQALEVGDQLLALAHQPAVVEPAAAQADVKAIETEGDEITRELIQLLNTQYVTPFDREDIYEPTRTRSSAPTWSSNSSMSRVHASSTSGPTK